jgi:flagellar motor switch protein FliN/FliY
MEEHPAWPMISRLPVMLAVRIPLSRFKVCNLLALKAGQTIESVWAVTEDVPLKVGMLQVSWGEFEVVEQSMALRLTRLA